MSVLLDASTEGPQIIVVGNRSEMPFNGYSSGSNQNTTYRDKRWNLSGVACGGLRLTYINATLTATGEVVPPDTITLNKVTIESAAGLLIPVFFNGRRSVTIEPGAQVTSDPVGLTVAALSYFYVRSYVGVDTLGKKWPVSSTTITAEGEGYSTTDFADGAVPTLFSASLFGPAIVTAVAQGRRPVIGIVGSSSAYGQGDTAEAPYYDLGYPARAFAAKNISYVKLTRASDTLLQFLTNHRLRMQLLAQAGVTHVLQQLGSNDISNGASAATTISRLQDVTDIITGAGIKVINTTITQKVSGTYATLSGQVPSSDSGRRHDVNDWLRTGPTGSSGLLDAAAATAAPEDISKFRIDGGAWTVDGTHLTQIAHQQVSAAFQAQLHVL